MLYQRTMVILRRKCKRVAATTKFPLTRQSVFPTLRPYPSIEDTADLRHLGGRSMPEYQNSKSNVLFTLSTVSKISYQMV